MTSTNLDEFLGKTAPSKRQRLLKWSLIALAAILVVLLIWRAFRGADPVSYATAVIERGDLTVTIAATGNLAPTKQVSVGSEQSGLIAEVYVQNNDRVTKGQPLANLDLARLRDALVQSKASLQAALATVEQNRATVAQTKANLAREQEVFKLSGGKVPSATELDTARADFDRARANVATAEAQVAQARAQVSTNQTNLSKGTIYAPVTGLVLSRQVEPGQTVAASFTVATLFTIAEDLAKMKLEVKVDEADVGELKPGASASFTVDAYPGRTFPATVTRVDLGANATPTINSAGTTTASSSTVVAYTAVLSVDNSALLLKPGMTATANIITAQKKNVLLAPNQALRFTPSTGNNRGFAGTMLPRPPGMVRKSKPVTIGRGSQRLLWVLGADGQPASVNVTIGDTNGSVTEVSGQQLQPGMKVITGQLAAAAP